MAGNRVKETNTTQFFGKRSLWTDKSSMIPQPKVSFDIDQVTVNF